MINVREKLIKKQRKRNWNRKLNGRPAITQRVNYIESNENPQKSINGSSRIIT